MNKIIIYITLFLALIGLAMAETELGVFRQNDCIILKQLCADCTYNNITSVISPSSLVLLNGSPMTKIGTEYNKTFCTTSEIGNYNVNGVGDLSGIQTIWTYTFEITSTGTKSESSEFFNLIVFMVFFLLSIVFIILMHKTIDDNAGSSIAYGAFSSVLMFIIGSMISLGFQVLRPIIVVININYYLAAICYVIGLYTAIHSVMLYKHNQPVKSDFDVD